MIMLALFACSGDRSIFGDEVKFVCADKQLAIVGEQIFFDEETAPYGAYCINCADDVLFATLYGQEELIAAYALPDLRFLGRAVKAGRGPGEFTMVAYYDQYEVENDSLYLNLYNINSNFYCRYNLTEALRSHRPVFRETPNIPPYSFVNLRLSDTTHWVQRLDGQRFVHQIIDVRDGKIVKDLPVISCKNDTYRRMVSSIERLKPDGTKIASGLLFQNQMSIYDLETGGWVSVTTGDRAPTIGEIAKRANSSSDSDGAGNCYFSMTVTDDWILGLFYDNQNIRAGLGHVHIFDWTGRLRYDLNLREQISAIAYDEARKTLYAMTYDDELYYRYDLSEIGL